MNIDVTISIHALLAESDYSMGRNEKSFRGYFYPRSPCGERLRGWTLNINGPIFLSTLSLRRATPTQQRKTKTNEFLSTLSLRRATGLSQVTVNAVSNFYPRSPCGERRWTLQNHQDTSPISIHALLAESDVSFMLYDTSSLIFLSTLSLRRATRKAVTTRGNYRYFYPRSPCGERHLRVVDGSKSSIISIHALLAESDVSFMLYDTSSLIFLSTLSLRRATPRGGKLLS